MLLWMGCSWLDSAPTVRPRPTGLPDDAVRLHYLENDIALDDTPLDPWKAFAQDDPDQVHGPLFEALGDTDLWIDLPANATWTEARRGLQTAREAGIDTAWLGREPLIGPLLGSARLKTVMSCPELGVDIVGADTVLTFEVQQLGSKRWTTAHARFVPVIRRPGEPPMPVQLLPDTCWRAHGCSILGDPTSIRACEAARSERATPTNRIPIGNSSGCLASTAESKAQTSWRADVPATLTHLGLDATTMAHVAPDETVPLGDVTTLLAGLHDHGITSPGISLLNMGSGEEPPTCDAPIQSEEQLLTAKGRWFGATLAQLAAQDAP